MTTKRKRKYGQDFSVEKHGRITDSSFAPACDVNAIVRHYQQTGLDPYADRIKNAQYGEASTMTFSEAMQTKAELDSSFALLPLSVQAEHDNSAIQWYESLATQTPPTEAQEPSPDTPEQPAPQDAAPDNSDGKVQ